MAALPHATHHPPLLSLLFALIALAWGWRWRYRPASAGLPGWQLLLLVGLVLLATVNRFGSVAGREAGVALLTGMAAVKMFECRSERDGVVVTLISYFLAMTNFLFHQTVFMAIYLTGVMGWLTAGLILPILGASGNYRAALQTATRLILQAVVLMVPLFVLFPRISGPLWNMPHEGEEASRSARSGLGDTMTPGTISHLSLSSEVAFRVRFAGDPPPAAERYWRGPVLSTLRLQTWSLSPTGTTHSPPTIEPEGRALTYEILLEPHHQVWLLALDLPTRWPPEARQSREGSLFLSRPVRQSLRYTVTSHPRYWLEPYLSPEELRATVSLPFKGNPRSRELGRAWLQKHPEPQRRVQEALAMFRQEPFTYTLNPPLLGQDGIDAFLFDSRRGFCEHFAGAMTYLMRAAEVPARVVTGYLGGEFNPIDGTLTVRQSDAHAWMEVWLSDSGWTRVDPTAAVAPERVLRSLAELMPEGELSFALMRSRWEWFRPFRLVRDSLEGWWSLWVLDYNDFRQLELWQKVGIKDPSSYHVVVALVAAVGLVLAVWALLVLGRGRRHSAQDPVGRIYQHLGDRLAKVGIHRHPWQGPQTFLAWIAIEHPEVCVKVEGLIAEVIRLRYGPVSSPGEVRRLARQVRKVSL